MLPAQTTSKGTYFYLRSLRTIPVPRRFPAGHALRRAEGAYRLAMDRALEPAGVTSSQFTVMALVHTHPDSSSADIARRVGVTAQTMKDLVANLESASLVRRDRHPEHGRILTLHLTDRGEAALERCWRLARQVERRMLVSFTSEERRVFVDHLLRAGDALLQDERSRTRA